MCSVSNQSDAPLDTPDDRGTAQSSETGATSEGPACWVVQLNDTTHIADNNCLGIRGWNDVETDPGPLLPSKLEVIYTDSVEGDYCRIITPAPAVAWSSARRYREPGPDVMEARAVSLGLGMFGGRAAAARRGPSPRDISMLDSCSCSRDRLFSGRC